VCSSDLTSAYKIQTPGNYPEESIQHTWFYLKLENYCIKCKGYKHWFSGMTALTSYWLDNPEFSSLQGKEIVLLVFYETSRNSLGGRQATFHSVGNGSTVAGS
jgi:hypothetical protein